MRFKAVFFDAGDTLLAAHPSFHELFALTLASQGQPVTASDVERAFTAIAPSFTEVLDKLGTSEWSTSKEVSRKFWRGVYHNAFEHLGVADPDDELADALYERFTRFESYRLFPDALPALEAIKAAGITVGLISNFEDWLEGMLIEMEIAHVFDLMVISGKVGLEKPDPAIFHMALDRAGASADESMYVGDHPRVDAQASAAVGMTSVLIDRKGRNRDFEGERIESLYELMPMLGIS
ncbi:MAG: HAD-IA family hydrolase [Actinomycetota bacterium]